MTAREAGRPLRVLFSTPPPGPRTNPYVVSLHEAVRAAGVEVVPFTWRAALLGRYDVVHTHWPETLVRGRGPLRTLLRQGLTALWVVRARLTGVPVVRSLHNLRPHETVRGRRAALLLRRVEALESWWVRLNEHTSCPVPGRTVTAPLGDFVEWARGRPVAPSVPGRVVAPGIVRRYKGLEELVAAFALVEHPGATLHVLGQADDEDLVASLRRAADHDPRVTLTLAHVSDDDLALAVRRAQLVVLPYREMHNSSAMLLALSLERPVLVPRLPVTEQLADALGRDWVLTDDTGDVRALADAVERALVATALAPSAPPDLSRHDWVSIGEIHADVYRAATGGCRGGGP